MKGIFVVLAVIACASALTTVDKEWEAFKTQFAKSYSGEEDVRRHGIFAANKKMIEEHNKKYEAKEVTFFMAVNKFADMTEDEISLLKGFKRSPEEIKNKVNLYKPKVGVSNPDTLDWRNYGYVTGVKDQGQCGSCWSFSSTGALEGQHFRYHGALISLSEQNLVDCVTTNAGCNGGWMDDAFTYVGQTGGIDTEANYPYEAADDVCRYHGGTSGVTLWGYVDLPYGDETSLWDATANVGPIAVAIDASWASFNYYGGGVYYEPSCTVNNLDHAVLVAGYGNDNGADYWLVKNSWGSSWGEAGYIRMSRNANNQCGIASAASYPLVN